MVNIVEIKSDKIKDYVVSFKACKLSIAGCKLQPKFGKVVFNLSAFSNIEKCVLYMKKMGGNGIVSFIKPKIGDTSIFSRQIQHVDVIPGTDGTIYIMRPIYSTGDIDICGIVLYLNDDIKQNADMNHINWKYIISRCNKHHGLRLIRGKLFATEGGFIDGGGSIENCYTDPPNLFYNKGTKIIFKGACRIINITFKESNSPVISPQVPEYKHVNAPTPIAVKNKEDEHEERDDKDIFNTYYIRDVIENGHEDNISDNIIYNSDTMNGFHIVKVCNNKLVRYVRSNNQDYIVLKHGGHCDLPISQLKSNKDYICIIYCKKYNGNGKLFVQFITQTSQSTQSKVILTNNLSNQYLKLKTPEDIEYGSSYKLRLSLITGISSGEVLIGKIIILEDLTFNSSPVKEKIDKTEQLITTVYNNKIDNTIDGITRSFKLFSLVYPDTFKVNTKYDTAGIIKPCSYNTLQWITKILPFFPNIKINSYNFISKENKTYDTPDIVMGKIGELDYCDRVWIEEFSGKSLSKKDIDIIKKAKKIFSPSISNLQFLRKKFSVNATLVPKVWPYVEGKSYYDIYYKPYCLILGRNKKFVNMIANTGYKQTNMVVLGMRGVPFTNMIYIPEYLPYIDLFKMIYNAKFIVDLPDCNHYVSAVLDLAMILGIPIVTTNHWMSISQPKATFVKSILNKSMLEPDMISLKKSLNFITKDNRTKLVSFDGDSYNLNLLANVNLMLR